MLMWLSYANIKHLQQIRNGAINENIFNTLVEFENTTEVHKIISKKTTQS